MTTMMNFIRWVGNVVALLLIVMPSSAIQAETQLLEIRWKSEQQIRDAYGEPNAISNPVGTHASYVKWEYDDFVVVFANGNAFHQFKKDSLTKTLQLEEGRAEY
ncbi:MAG: hypothetical protein AAF197_03780 [Pseudomonadota bacterium]